MDDRDVTSSQSWTPYVWTAALAPTVTAVAFRLWSLAVTEKKPGKHWSTGQVVEFISGVAWPALVSLLVGVLVLALLRNWSRFQAQRPPVQALWATVIAAVAALLVWALWTALIVYLFRDISF